MNGVEERICLHWRLQGVEGRLVFPERGVRVGQFANSVKFVFRSSKMSQKTSYRRASISWEHLKQVENSI